MTLDQKFERRVKQIDQRGRHLYGTSYITFWRYMHLLRRVNLLIDRDRFVDMDGEIREHPELALYN